MQAAVLTNVRRANLDYHGSVRNYRRAKQRLFDCLSPDGFAVINADDPGSRSLLSTLDHPVMTVGMDNPAELTATVVERHNSEQTFLLEAGCETVPVRTRNIGDDFVRACLMAAAVGLASGIDLETVVRGLEAVDQIPGRMEFIRCGQPFTVLVDGAGTADALSGSLQALRSVTRRRVICVFGAGDQLAASERPQLGRVVERLADISVITNDNPGLEPPLQIAHDILDGFDRPALARLLPDRAKAICWALAEAQSGDAVLIAGKGCDDYQSEGSRLYHFDDREVIRHWLSQMRPDATCPWTPV
jgi:UDP-N-acetylmuramoyl-L-alanyl-D-glutamate--2,6-diaminopimelate ligase